MKLFKSLANYIQFEFVQETSNTWSINKLKCMSLFLK